MSDFNIDDIEQFEEEKKRQEEEGKNKESDSSSIGKALGAAGIGALNQYNLLPYVAGAFSTMSGQKPEDVSKEDWDKASLKEKYWMKTEPIKKRIEEIEDDNKVASAVGNILGGLFTGGAALKGAAKGAQAASKYAPEVLKKVGSKIYNVSPTAVKLGGASAAGATMAGADSAMFERDPEKKGEAFKRGATFGAAVPMGLVGLKGLLSSGGKLTKKYIKKAPEIAEQRKSDPGIVSTLQDEAVAKADDVTTKVVNDNTEIVNSIKSSLGEFEKTKQVQEAALMDKVYGGKRALGKEISKESGAGYDLLSENKFLPTDGLQKKIDDIIKKVDKSDPAYKDLVEMQTRIAEYGGKANEVELKNLQKALSNKVDYALMNKGEHTPLAMRAFSDLSADTRQLLVKSNPEYKALMEKLAPDVERAKAISENLKLKGEAGVSLARLKNYKHDIKINKSIEDYKELTGIDLKPEIDKLNEMDKVFEDAVALTKDDKAADTLIENLSGLYSNAPKYKNIQKTIKAYDNISGNNFTEAIDQARLKYNIDLLNKVKSLTKQNDAGVSKFQKNVKNLNLVEPKNKNILERVTSDSDSSIKTKKTKDKKAREDISTISTFLERNPEKDIQGVENISLYEAMGSGNPNGSREVNYGAVLGGLGGMIAKGTALGGGIGAAAGATVGALKKAGILNKVKREAIDQIYSPVYQKRNQIINDITNYESRMGIPVEIQKQINRENENQKRLEEYYYSDPMSKLIEDKKEMNKKYFDR